MSSLRGPEQTLSNPRNGNPAPRCCSLLPLELQLIGNRFVGEVWGLVWPSALQATLIMTSSEKKATADEFLHLGGCLQHCLRLATGSVSGPLIPWESLCLLASFLCWWCWFRRPPKHVPALQGHSLNHSLVKTAAESKALSASFQRPQALPGREPTKVQKTKESLKGASRQPHSFCLLGLLLSLLISRQLQD